MESDSEKRDFELQQKIHFLEARITTLETNCATLMGLVQSLNTRTEPLVAFGSALPVNENGC
jgi:hypothetical protein